MRKLYVTDMSSYRFGDKIEEYELIKEIGNGSFGTVYYGMCRNTNLKVAIKTIKKGRLASFRFFKQIKQETDIHLELDHPSIIKLYNWFEDDNYVYLILELCEQGSIENYLKKNNKLTEEEARSFMRQIVEGLEYLHAKGIMHRDLKLANILLTEDMKVKIADFGLAKKLPNLPHSDGTLCGTPNYLAPEIANRNTYGLECDIWSLGIILYRLLTGFLPFDENNVRETISKVKEGKVDIPNYLSSQAQELLDSMLQTDPTKRLKLFGVVNHPFIKHNRNDSVMKPKLDRQASADSGLDSSGPLSLSSTRGSASSRTSKPLLATSTCGYSSRPFVTSTLMNKQQDHHSLPQCFHSETGLQISNDSDRHCDMFNKCHMTGQSYNGFQRSSEFINLNKRQTASCEFPNRHQNCRKGGGSSSVEKLSYHVKSTAPSSLERKPIDQRRRILPPPLNTMRLRPIESNVKKINAKLAILKSREVMVKLYRIYGGEEITYERCTISPDGRMIDVNLSENGTGVFSYDNLPNIHWKKYELGARFVELRRATTPKLIYYHKNNKFMLMENGPDADFEALFDSKEKFYKAKNVIKITDKKGDVITVANTEKSQNLPSDLKRLMDIFNKYHQFCVEWEAYLTEGDKDPENSIFPSINGQKPSSPSPNQPLANKENVLENCMNRNSSSKSNLDNIISHINTLDLRKHCESSYRSRETPVLCDINIQGSRVRKVPLSKYGWTQLYSSDEIEVLLNDGTSYIFPKDQPYFFSTDEYGKTSRYNIKPNGCSSTKAINTLLMLKSYAVSCLKLKR